MNSGKQKTETEKSLGSFDRLNKGVNEKSQKSNELKNRYKNVMIEQGNKRKATEMLNKVLMEYEQKEIKAKTIEKRKPI